MQSLIIRTSDTNQFRRCRVAWDFGSKIRMNYEPRRGAIPLEFGTAWHCAMEVVHDPKRASDPRQVVYTEAWVALKGYLKEWQRRESKLDGYDGDVFPELIELGKGMLTHYAKWEKTHPIKGEVMYTEVEFEVKIPVPWQLYAMVHRRGFGAERDPDHPEDETLYLTKGGNPTGGAFVVFQGRIDLVTLWNGRVIIWDHKTAAQFPESVGWLDKDAQAGRYCWALKQMLGIDVDMVIFRQARKKLPDPPQVLKNGTLSKNKSQRTTPEVYRAEIKRLNHNPAYYADFLATFQGQEYFRDIETYRSRQELENLGLEVLYEALDMLGDPLIYRSPSQFACDWCAYNAPCTARFDGSDWEFILEQSGSYRLRSEAAAYE